MKKALIPLLFAGLAFGCDADAVGPSTDDAPLSASVVAAACQGVEFQAALTFPPGAGTVTGDLEGDLVAVFPEPPVPRGVGFHTYGTDYITVQSSAVAGLSGTIEHQHVGMNVVAPGLSPFGRINGHGTIVGPEGVSGHLNYHGTWDFSSFPFAIDLTYRGNICVD